MSGDYLEQLLHAGRIGAWTQHRATGRVVAALSSGPPTQRHSCLWELAGGPPRRLTFSAAGEDLPVALHDGSTLFLSARPFPAGNDGQVGLWSLPPGGGEARPLLQLPTAPLAVAAAATAPVIVLAVPMHAAAHDLDDDERMAQRRTAAGAAGILLDGYPVRAWSRWLGPRQPRLLRLTIGADSVSVDDLTGPIGAALDSIYGVGLAIAPDGDTVYVAWRSGPDPFATLDLVAIDGTGRRTLATDADHFLPAVSPDGRHVVSCRRPPRGTDGPDRSTLWIVDVDTGAGRELADDCPGWPLFPTWTPDGQHVLFTAERGGRAPLWEVDIVTGATRVVADGAAYTLPLATSDGIWAQRSTLDRPPHPVRVDPITGAAGEVPLPLAAAPRPVGRTAELHAIAPDGAALRSWMLMPPPRADGTPPPVVVWIHGGPPGSWTGWHGYWFPHVLAEHGYAVLLPDPGQSLGYGAEFGRRGWSRWGSGILPDVLAALDAAIAEHDLDSNRVAAIGGSFGGYLVNWIAGHSNRFRALVNYAGIYDLERQHRVSDLGVSNEFEFGDPYADASRYAAESPHRAISRFRTPMLVTHGERDYRVGIDQALHLWTDLQRHAVPSRLLVLPDESHGISTPGNLRLWYATVLAFLDEHVWGEPWRRPELA